MKEKNLVRRRYCKDVVMCLSYFLRLEKEREERKAERLNMGTREEGYVFFFQLCFSFDSVFPTDLIELVFFQIWVLLSPTSFLSQSGIFFLNLEYFSDMKYFSDFFLFLSLYPFKLEIFSQFHFFLRFEYFPFFLDLTHLFFLTWVFVLSVFRLSLLLFFFSLSSSISCDVFVFSWTCMIVVKFERQK